MDPVESPCRQVCRLGPDQVCDGCGRTIVEITRWLEMDQAQRQRVLDRVRSWAVRGPGVGESD